ncbi:MAG: DUF2064 domain-containing protein [Thermoleophilia bacterium]
MTVSAAVVVIATSPVPGRALTRLCPPLEHAQAAALAEAALADTLQSVAWTPAVRRVVALDGAPGSWLPAGFDAIEQGGTSRGERLASVVTDVGEPLLLLWADTPQLTRALLYEALERLAEPQTDAVLGPTADGGCWAIGLAQPDPRAFDGMRSSSRPSAARQGARLHELGLRATQLDTLQAVHTFDDAVAVASLAPWTRFAATLELLTG